MARLEIDFSFERDSLDAAFEELERECTQIVRGLTVWVFESILNRTPQFYGRMVASWSYSLNAPEFVDRSDMVPAANTDEEDYPPHSRGWQETVSIAKAENAGNEYPFKLGDTVFLANGADHGEGPYALDVEQGRVPLRSVNRPGQPVRRTLDVVQSRFSQDISPRAGQSFKDLYIAY